jgi:hypothetical protein
MAADEGQIDELVRVGAEPLTVFAPYAVRLSPPKLVVKQGFCVLHCPTPSPYICNINRR